MMPIAPLMIEHRLIERFIRLLPQAAQRIREQKQADVPFILTAVDFIRMYADRCHHGKEEDILFRDLNRKGLSPEHKRILGELVAEHGMARGKVRSLVEATERYSHRDPQAVEEIARLLFELADFYPRHIEKEDRHFFVPVMAHFDPKEQARMFEEFWEFDRRLIHEKYKAVVESLEKNPA